jgi:hypothetical protein
VAVVQDPAYVIQFFAFSVTPRTTLASIQFLDILLQVKFTEAYRSPLVVVKDLPITLINFCAEKITGDHSKQPKMGMANVFMTVCLSCPILFHSAGWLV